jgi:porphobilinogen synthase
MKLGVPALALFPVIDAKLKTPDGREALEPRRPGSARACRG